jgi:unsaturated rhamnogalacturonyl hydrolase
MMQTDCSTADKKSKTETDYLHWAIKTADSFIQRSPDFQITYEENREKHKWHYEQGLMLNALYRLWQVTGDRQYYNFICENINLYVSEDGNISSYRQNDYKLDDIGPGRALLWLYENTNVAKYKKAADLLRQQLERQPRTVEGGFWHKQIYPWQMWLDGLYMAAPFYTQYALMFNETEDLNDVVNQFTYLAQHTFDAETGLYYHGWDERRIQKWANPETGCSASFWGRAIGWYMMALVDVLGLLPQDYQRREELVTIIRQLSASVLKYRDPESRVWYQVIDQGNRTGNYLEASASAMFVYAFTKGANQGYLDDTYRKEARYSFEGILHEFVQVDSTGLVNMLQTCSSAGLGGKDQRDGSFEYYINEPQRVNDFKAIGPFILGAIELEKSQLGTEE